MQVDKKMSKKIDYTPLVGLKWTHERLSKIHFIMFSKFLKQIQQSKFTDQEKDKRIRQQLQWFTRIEQMCLAKEITIKKA